MPKDEENNLGKKEPSESSKKASSAVTHGLANYLGAGEAVNALEKAPVTGNIISKQNEKNAKKIDKNPMLKKQAEILDKSGVLDNANSIMNAKNGKVPGSEGSGSELVSPLSKGKGSSFNSNDNELDNQKSNDDGVPSDKLNNKSSGNKKDNSGEGNTDLEGTSFNVSGNVSTIIKVISIISIITVPLLIICLSVIILNSVTNRFNDLSGYFQVKDGHVGGSDYSSGNEDADRFYEKFVEIENEYKDNDIYVNGELVMAAITIITRNSNNWSYTDFNDSFIRAFFDAGIEEESFNSSTFKENVFDLLRNNLDDSFSDKFIQEEIDDIDNFLNQYDKYIGNDSSGMACNLTGSTTDDVFHSLTTEEFIELVGPMMQQASAMSKQQGYNLFPSVLIAQAAHESGWGKKAIHNNLFGIKCHGYERCVSTRTTENYGGSDVKINDDFRIYDSIEESIINRNEFLIENKRYTTHGVFTAITPEQQVSALKAAGYATDPDYVALVTSIIDDYNLEEWDTNVNFCSSSDTLFSPRTVKPTIEDEAFTMITQSNRGQCVWYVRGRVVEVAMELEVNGAIDFSTAEFIIDSVRLSEGDGGQWYDKAAGYGFFEYSDDINKVEAGAIISWKRDGHAGHVAFVEDVNYEQNTITITDGYTTSSSLAGTWEQFHFKTRTMSLDAYFSSFGPNIDGRYEFSGYVYPFKPIM